MISKLFLKNSNEVFKQYNFVGNKQTDPISLSKINIFVGANNSGKSRLLRELFKSFHENEKASKSKFNYIDFQYISLDKAKEEFSKITESFKLVASNRNQEIDDFYMDTHKNSIDNQITYNSYSTLINKFNFRKDGTITPTLKRHNDKYDAFIQRKISELKDVTFSTYIPILRSLKKIGDSILPLKDRVKKDYYNNFELDKLNVFTGEELFKIIKKAKVSPPEERKKIKEFEKFLNEAFFKSFVEINALEYIGKDKDGKDMLNTNEDIYLTLGDENEFPIYNIGDGIQAIILLTFPIFFNSDKNHLLFIEEPELNLHPGLQRLFLETLNEDRFKNTQVFITTHSNHFLDLAIETSPETSIFSFTKKHLDENGNPNFEVNNITHRASEALHLLGVNTSSVFLSNCTIWVEGISDRLYIRKYLDIYQKEKGVSVFKEDIHYSFVEYAGNNITHWSFLDSDDEENENINYESISRNIFLITDLDKGKDERHKKLKDKLGDNYCCLERLEIENLLNPEILKATIEGYKKKDNVQLKKIDYSSYDKTDIGEYINSIIIDPSEINQITTIPNGCATRKIKDKYKFAKNAISNIKKLNDLSKDAQDLTERIYKFIQTNNNI